MKIAIVGSRDVYVDNIGIYIPENTSVIVSGGANGIDNIKDCVGVLFCQF